MAGPSASDVTTAQQQQPAGLDRLAPALGILDSFNHRNKNQHRLSKWWGPFDMLRRGLRRLVAEVDACADAEAAAAPSGGGASGSSRKKGKGRKAAAQKERDDALRRGMEARARHVHDQLVPRAFLAFTQLAADNQYAQLGLALLGVLAQVHAALAPLASPAVEECDEGAAAAAVVEGATLTPTPTTAPPGRGPGETSVDLGVAVSRTEMASRKKPAVGEEETPAKPERREKKKDKTRRNGEEPSGQGEEEGLRTAAGDSPEVVEKPRKKKRRDEFDDIFGSLETDEPSKKKKTKKTKSKKKDEFDDIFGSLL